jgi:putative intracellular protease/amidase
MTSNAEHHPSLLIVLSGADHWTLKDGSEHPTGFWAEELLTPLKVFRDAGVDVTLATPGGVPATVDDASLTPEQAGGEDRAAELRRELEEQQSRLQSPKRLEDVNPDDYDGVFMPGGHAPMEDLAVSGDLGRLLVTMLDDQKVVAAVCHGPAALLSATRQDGSWAFADRKLSGFTNDEEQQAGLADQAPWLLENRLREGGAEVSTGKAWQPFSVVDRNVVTGQNPASSMEVAHKTVEGLRGRMVGKPGRMVG